MSWFKSWTKKEVQEFNPKSRCWYNKIEFVTQNGLGYFQAYVWYSYNSVYYTAITWDPVLYTSKPFDDPDEAREWLDDWGENFKEWCEYIIPLTKTEKYCET